MISRCRLHNAQIHSNRLKHKLAQNELGMRLPKRRVTPHRTGQKKSSNHRYVDGPHVALAGKVRKWSPPDQLKIRTPPKIALRWKLPTPYLSPSPSVQQGERNLVVQKTLLGTNIRLQS